MIELACPGCATSLRIPADRAGKTLACPRCKTPVRVPGLAPAAPTPAKAGAAAPAGTARPGLTTPVKLAVIGGTSALLLSCVFCCGIGGFMMFLRPSAAKEQVAETKKGSRPAGDAKAARTKKDRKPSGGFTPNDADLLDFEERCKVLTTRIKLGMSKKQVEAVLGMPDDEDEKDLGELNPAKEGQILETWTWRDELNEKKFIMVGFVNGSLMDAETNALGQFGWNISKGYRTKPLGK